MEKIKTFEDYALAMDRMVILMATIDLKTLRQENSEFKKLSRRCREYENN